MQKDNKLFEDMARLGAGAVGGLMDIKRDIEAMVSTQLEKLLQKMNLVTREEFDTVREMLVKSREEQEEIKKQLDALHKRKKA